jgi:hypothetical protein
LRKTDNFRESETDETEAASSRLISRRRLLQLGVSSVPLPLILAACGDEGGVSGDTGVDPVEESVGRASGEDAYVAVVILEGRTPDQKEVVGYICNGIDTFAESFRGLANGNEVDLVSEDGDARLKASLTSEGATGSVELPDGNSVTFETAKAEGDNPAGLYDVALYSDGTLVGTSWENKRLVASGAGGIHGKVILPDGASVGFDVEPSESQEESKEAGEFRVVLLPDGTGRGTRTKRTVSTSEGFSVPIHPE